jgi:hypothetical protein
LFGHVSKSSRDEETNHVILELTWPTNYLKSNLPAVLDQISDSSATLIRMTERISNNPSGTIPDCGKVGPRQSSRAAPIRVTRQSCAETIP